MLLKKKDMFPCVINNKTILNLHRFIYLSIGQVDDEYLLPGGLTAHLAVSVGLSWFIRDTLHSSLVSFKLGYIHTHTHKLGQNNPRICCFL